MPPVRTHALNMRETTRQTRWVMHCCLKQIFVSIFFFWFVISLLKYFIVSNLRGFIWYILYCSGHISMGLSLLPGMINTCVIWRFIGLYLGENNCWCNKFHLSLTAGYFEETVFSLTIVGIFIHILFRKKCMFLLNFIVWCSTNNKSIMMLMAYLFYYYIVLL